MFHINYLLLRTFLFCLKHYTIVKIFKYFHYAISCSITYGIFTLYHFYFFYIIHIFITIQIASCYPMEMNGYISNIAKSLKHVNFP